MPTAQTKTKTRSSAPRRLGRAVAFMHEARQHERAGRVSDAIRAYQSSIEGADAVTEGTVLAESLRRLGNMYRRRHELGEAITCYHQSHEVAVALNDNVLAAEALNGIALVHFQRGEWEEARRELRLALSLGADSEGLRARIEQNFGVMANIEGDFRSALNHYQRSLESFRRARDEGGCAIAYHNLGMISADREMWADADGYFRSSLEIADASGDVNLRGHVLLNRTEVHLASGRFEEARKGAEEALQIFDRLGSRNRKADAYRFLGMLYRETGYPVLADARLRTAVELAEDVGAGLEQAEASRELALLYQATGRNQDSLKLLNTSHRLFGRLNARRDLVDVASKVAHLESVYLEIVRGWGRSIESSDSYTFGHSERVAGFAIALGTALGIDDADLTTIRIGSYLHDLGKVRIPHEILNKPGRLTSDEFEIMKMHPVYGLEMLASVEFPWDIKPIIRSHHEKIDGSGYPDRLRGEEIPLTAQVVCVADVFDALTTTRSYRGAMTHEVAMAEMVASQRWWRPEVFEGFIASLGVR